MAAQRVAARIPRRGKRRARRPATSQIPAYIQALDAPVGQEDRDYLRRKLEMKLGKFSHFVKRVSVRIMDVNGPRGGLDKQCRIKVVLLRGLPPVVVEQQHAALQAAMDLAVQRTVSVVKRSVQRRTNRPRRTRDRGAVERKAVIG